MADSAVAPLLPLPLPHHDQDHPPSLAGVTHLLQAILVSLAWFFDAQQTFISVFADADPAWHCTTPNCSSTPCNLPSDSWVWDHPKHTSMISDFDLQCSSPALIGLPASSYFIGCLVGGLAFASLADSVLGRKNMLFLSGITMSFTGALTFASPNVWAYSALRFICGAARATLATCAIVLATELVETRWRDKISIVAYFFFTFGFLSLPAMAYIGRESSWRYLYLWTSIPSFFYSVLVYFLVQESPRWLLVRSENADVFKSLKILWEKRWAFRRLAAVMIVSFGMGLVYYGMPLNVGNLGGSSNLYMSVTYNALAELPASLMTLFVIGMLNRKISSLVFTTVSGVSSVLCVFVSVRAGGLRMAAELLSFFSACTAFNVLLIFSMELFPTCVRNSAVAMVRQALVFGGVFAPMLVAVGRKRREVSFAVFGLVIGCCGVFVACLPETRGSNMSDTIEQEECKAISQSVVDP